MFFMMDDYDTFFKGQLQKIFKKKCCSFELSIYQWILKKTVSEGSHDTEA